MADKKWYVLRTAGTKEKKAAEYLVKEIERHADLQSVVDQVLVPVKKEIVTKNGKRKEVERLLFPGYVLIHAELNPDLEYVIRNGIPGMSGFLTEKTGNGQYERIPPATASTSGSPSPSGTRRRPVSWAVRMRTPRMQPRRKSTSPSESLSRLRTVRSAVSAERSKKSSKTEAN